MRARCLFASVVLVVLVGCVPPATDAPPVPRTTPVPVAEAPAPVAETPLAPTYSNWIDAPATPGDWSWRSNGGESFAEFHSPSRQLLFQFNCTVDRDMVVAMTSTSLSGNRLRVRTETLDRTLTAAAREGWLETRLDVADPLLDAIAFSRGRFAVEAGTRALYLPAYPEVTRVIEDCR
jgi:hypothetical protein